MPMPADLRIVITESEVETGHVDADGTKRTVKVRRYQLAFGGKVICRDVNDRNLMEVWFNMYMFKSTFHPDVSLL